MSTSLKLDGTLSTPSPGLRGPERTRTATAREAARSDAGSDSVSDLDGLLGSGNSLRPPMGLARRHTPHHPRSMRPRFGPQPSHSGPSATSTCPPATTHGPPDAHGPCMAAGSRPPLLASNKRPAEIPRWPDTWPCRSEATPRTQTTPPRTTSPIEALATVCLDACTTPRCRRVFTGRPPTLTHGSFLSQSSCLPFEKQRLETEPFP